MPKPRSQLISLDDTPWYHCISRCVRRAWLCGYDKNTDTDYEYRRQWVVDRLELLSHVFSIEIAAFSVMSNHHHVVLRVDTEKIKHWSMQDIVRRWHKVYHGNFISQKFVKGEALCAAEKRVLEKNVMLWKERLISISWFMRSLNEPIARKANQEDNCTGKFFESRFKSQALLDEKAILACMAYVDLNPIRANLAKTPEDSEYTSIQARTKQLKRKRNTSFLAPFKGSENTEMTAGVPYHLKDYLELIDWTGRAIRNDKAGSIDNTQPQILQGLALNTEDWLVFATDIEKQFSNWVGSSERFKSAASQINQRWICQRHGCLRFYG